MRDLLKHLLSSQNQFASGGLMLMIFGGIGVFLRSLPEILWSWIVRQCTMTITVKDDDAAFVWVKEWFLEQEFSRRLRQVDLDTTLRGAELALIPAPGHHLFWHAGRPFWVWLYRSEDTKGARQRRMESLTFQTIGRKQIFLRHFADEVVACHRRKVRVSSYLYIYDDYWAQVEAYSPRLLDSVILKPGEKSISCRTSSTSAPRARVIAASVCLTTAAICSTALPAPAKRRLFRLWLRSSACPSTSSI